MKRKFIYNIEPSDENKTIKTFLVGGGRISLTCLKKIKFADDGILLNGNRVFVTAKLTSGDKLEINIADDAESTVIPVNGDLNILYEDEDILAIDKPPYMPVHPSKGHPEDSLANIVMAYYKKNGIKSPFRCVTRLDTNTSGVVIIAKNAVCHDSLRKQLIAGSVVKKYHALVHGITDENGTVNAPIIRPDEATIKRVISENGAHAITHYKKLHTENDLSFIEVTPETGRTHQIRLHMSHIGHPLCGDFLYGNENDGFKRQMLHASQITFIHPTSKNIVTIKSKNDRWLYE
ncbi:MAG: RluA family pseudouridine synthase [Clostridia bacterium]|nr:RluA family pseudouridine synthase [Clostridia bacterium]